MRTPSLIRSFAAVLALLALTTSVVFAKPGHGDGKVTISGPGINGVFEITDPELRTAVDPFNFMPDWNPYIEQPKFAEGEGYVLTYYVKYEDGTYEVSDTLRYVPNPMGGTGYVYYIYQPYQPASGPDGMWFQLRPAGEALMQRLLAIAGVTTAPAAASRSETSSLTSPDAAVPARPAWASGWLVALGVAVVSALALSGVLLQLRARPVKA